MSKHRIVIFTTICFFCLGVGEASEPPVVGAFARNEKVEASSELVEKTASGELIQHFAWHACDHNWNTAWVEGATGFGKDEWLKITFDTWGFKDESKALIHVRTVWIANGFSKDKKTYYANNRVKTVELEFSNGFKKSVTLKDAILDYQQIDLRKYAIKASWVVFRIRSVYKGSKYDDTCIGEIQIEDIREFGDVFDVDEVGKHRRNKESQ